MRAALLALESADSQQRRSMYLQSSEVIQNCVDKTLLLKSIFKKVASDSVLVVRMQYSFFTMKSSILLLACVTLVAAIPPPHPDVVQVRREEELLPHHLRKPALHNPNLQEVLPLSSLLHPGEKLVFNREAHDVSRKEIYNILTHAGLISRIGIHSSRLLRHQPAVIRGHDPDILPFLHSQDLLQHL